jgi:outer membrane protein OmpA-like peptidoglycan-associated protein
MPLDLDGLDGVLQAGRDGGDLLALPTMVADKPPLPPPPPDEPRLTQQPLEHPEPPIRGPRSRGRRVAFLLGAIGLVVVAMVAVAVLLPSQRQDEPSTLAARSPTSAPASVPLLAPPVASAKPSAETGPVHPGPQPQPSGGAVPAPAPAPAAPPAASEPATEVASPTDVNKPAQLAELRLPFRFSFNGVRALPLSVAEAAQLDIVVHELAQRCGGDSPTIELTGHTDDLGSARANKIVGLGRATHARAVLARRPDAPPMTIATAGSSRPIASNQTRDGQNANRRVTAACAPLVPTTKESRP